MRERRKSKQVQHVLSLLGASLIFEIISTTPIDHHKTPCWYTDLDHKRYNIMFCLHLIHAQDDGKNNRLWIERVKKYKLSTNK
jgi:hypothetical protein